MVAGAGVEHAGNRAASTFASSAVAQATGRGVTSASASPAIQAAVQATVQAQAVPPAVPVQSVTMPGSSAALSAVAAKSSPSASHVHQLHTLVQPSSNTSTVLCTPTARGQPLPASPAWSMLAKARQSSVIPAVDMGGLAVARAVIREEGLLGLYRGFGASLMTFVPSSAIWWGSYSTYQRLIWQMKDSFLGLPEASRVMPLSTGEVVQVQTVAALFAGATASFATSPLDLVKTRIQVASKGTGEASTVRAVLMEILREDGWRGMFRGAVPRMANAALWGTCMVSTYEFLKRVAKKQD